MTPCTCCAAAAAKSARNTKSALYKLEWIWLEGCGGHSRARSVRREPCIFKLLRALEQTAGLTFQRLPQATEQLAQICLDRIEARKTAVKMRKSASCTVGNSGSSAARGSEDELSALADEVCFIRFGRELGRWLPL